MQDVGFRLRTVNHSGYHTKSIAGYRVRDRYAVISAWALKRYRSEEMEHISLLLIPFPCYNAGLNPGGFRRSEESSAEIGMHVCA